MVRRLSGADKGREGGAGYQGIRRFMDNSGEEREGLATDPSWTTGKNLSAVSAIFASPGAQWITDCL